MKAQSLDPFDNASNAINDAGQDMILNEKIEQIRILMNMPSFNEQLLIDLAANREVRLLPHHNLIPLCESIIEKFDDRYTNMENLEWTIEDHFNN